MLSNIAEKNVLKCHQYWPKLNDLMETESFQIKNIEEESSNDIVLRKFSLKKKNNDKVKIITQFHCISWIDRGITSIETVSNLLYKIEKIWDKSPLVIHCSAGCGRTGVFILVHSILEKVKYDLKNNTEPMINIYEELKRLRQLRHNLIQTPEQYEFCYHILNYEFKKFIN